MKKWIENLWKKMQKSKKGDHSSQKYDITEMCFCFVFVIVEMF